MTMAELCGSSTYGLSCARRGDRVSVLHVKLTEPAISLLENYHNYKNASSSQATIHFQGLQGRIRIPRREAEGSHGLIFYLSNFGKDNPQGSFECVRQQASSPGVSALSALGTIQDKLTVSASSPLTREREEERSRSRFLKPAAAFRERKVQARKPAPSAPDPAPERKQTAPINPANTIRKCLTNNPVCQRPYRERVVHLLALRSYKKLEVLARLQRDGVAQKDRNSLGSTLHQVAVLNPKDNSYSLKDFSFREVTRDWPGYTEDERLQVERILARKLGVSAEESVSSSSPDKDPCAALKLQETDFIDPLLPKKPRISHLSSRAPAETEDKKATPPATPARLGPPSSSNSPSTPEGRGSQDLPLEQSSVCGKGPDVSSGSPSPVCTVSTTTVTSTSAPPPAAGKKARKSRKHKEREQPHEGERKRERQQKSGGGEAPLGKKSRREAEPERAAKDTPALSTELPAPATPDYIHKYTALISVDQRQRYKDDFNAEYDEYRALHARVEGITRRFTQLDAQCRRLTPGTKEYQEVHEQVLQEYRNIKEHSPHYYEEKQRCEYLHNKLAHIKRLIADYDKLRALSWL